MKAVRPDRDHLEIRFPLVEGYRVELPTQRLTATFTDDSTAGGTAVMFKPVDFLKLTLKLASFNASVAAGTAAAGWAKPGT